jgi:hypothetical protein
MHAGFGTAWHVRSLIGNKKELARLGSDHPGGTGSHMHLNFHQPPTRICGVHLQIIVIQIYRGEATTTLRALTLQRHHWIETQLRVMQADVFPSSVWHSAETSAHG